MTTTPHPPTFDFHTFPPHPRPPAAACRPAVAAHRHGGTLRVNSFLAAIHQDGNRETDSGTGGGTGTEIEAGRGGGTDLAEHPPSSQRASATQATLPLSPKDPKAPASRDF